MGTNYYARRTTCEHCGALEELHIGKSSGGWCFALRVYPDKDINNWTDWLQYLTKVEIYDEYDHIISLDDFIHCVTKRSFPRTKFSEVSQQFLDSNYAVRGPNGLLRHRIKDSCICIGHGEGTYDYMVREFS